MNRPANYTIAAILALLFSLSRVVTAIPPLFQGPAAVEQAGTNPPSVLFVIGFGIGLLGLVAAYGVWRMQKWGVVLTILLRAVDGLTSVPGVLGAPTVQLKIASSFSTLISIVIIVLLLWRKSRFATTES